MILLFLFVCFFIKIIQSSQNSCKSAVGHSDLISFAFSAQAHWYFTVSHTHTHTLIYTVPFSGLKYIALIIVSLLSLLHVIVTYTNVSKNII